MGATTTKASMAQALLNFARLQVNPSQPGGQIVPTTVLWAQIRRGVAPLI